MPCRHARIHLISPHRKIARRVYRGCVAGLVVIGLLASSGGSMANAAQLAEPNGAATGDDNPFPRRMVVPDLAGGVDWINTAGPLELKDLRGKFVLLDFWTFCCINCMHILPELKKLEEEFPKELVVIGVHSAKFENEEDSKNITEAVLRYEIKHPVVNDAKHAIWNRYGVQSWPTAILIDPEGKAVYARSGEFKAAEFGTLIKQAIPYYRKKGTLDETPLRFDLAADRAVDTPLRFPGKVLADEPNDRLFIADSNHNRIVIADFDGTLVDIIGSGEIGAADGEFSAASFNHPQGMALDGDTLYVADTENHMLRKVDLIKRRVATIAGDGHQAQSWPGINAKAAADGNVVLPDRFVGKPAKTQLNSPWDLQIHGGDLYIAMAGPHQIWKMPLDESEIGVFAGNGREDIVDGPLVPKEPYEAGYCSFAQPSGLAADKQWLYVADSEGSSLRAVPFDAHKRVRTVIGTADLPAGRLFMFGDHDGSGKAVRLQHPLGVALVDGTLYVADTYNNKIKAVNLAKKTVRTIAGSGQPGHDDEPASFDEPAGIAAAGGKLYIADTNNHLIRIVDLEDNDKVSTFEVRGLTPPKPPATAEAAVSGQGREVRVDPVLLKPEDGLVWFKGALKLPSGYKINPIAPMRYKLSASPEVGVVDTAAGGRSIKVDPPSQEFTIEVPLSATEGEATVDVTLDYYYCREGATGVCKGGTLTWRVPLKLSATAERSDAPLSYAVE
jgi:thiol-disulfide isomerase/thioredoxin/DNA-binding beta-propeller fold protein YncE